MAEARLHEGAEVGLGLNWARRLSLDCEGFAYHDKDVYSNRFLAVGSCQKVLSR